MSVELWSEGQVKESPPASHSGGVISLTGAGGEGWKWAPTPATQHIQLHGPRVIQTPVGTTVTLCPEEEAGSQEVEKRKRQAPDRGTA